MHFDLIQSISLAGDSAKANDDRAGSGDTHAWVVDGSTDLSEPGLLGARGGAAWLAAEADRAFTDAADAPLDAICRAVFDRVATRYEATRTRDPVSAWELPSAAMLAVALRGGTLDASWIGDCTGLLIRNGAVMRVGPQPDIRDGESDLASSVAEHGLGDARPAPILAVLRTARENPNRRVLGVDPRNADSLFRASLPCAVGEDLVLMSDGFAALIDLYRLATPDELAAMLLSEGLHGIAARLRSAEAEDAACRRWPRFKRGDDATALWLRIADAKGA